MIRFNAQPFGMGSCTEAFEKLSQVTQEYEEEMILLAIVGLERAEAIEELKQSEEERQQAAHELDLALMNEERTRIKLAEKKLIDRLF